MKPVGLFDMDGTLCQHDEKLREDMLKIMSPGEEMPEDLFDDSKPYLKARMDLIRSQPCWWRNLKPLQLGWDVLRLAQKLGFEIEILTKGPRTKRRAWMEKGRWVDEHLGSETPINIVGKDKSRYYGHFLCEDYVPYLLGWLEHRPRGLGILIKNKKNADCTHPNVIHYDGTNLDVIEEHLKAVRARRPGDHWLEHLWNGRQSS